MEKTKFKKKKKIKPLLVFFLNFFLHLKAPPEEKEIGFKFKKTLFFFLRNAWGPQGVSFYGKTFPLGGVFWGFWVFGLKFRWVYKGFGGLSSNFKTFGA